MKIINLLPKSRQEELKYERVLRNVLKFFWLSFASFFIVIAVQYATKIFADAKLNSVQSEINSLKGLVSKKENSEVKKQVKALNDLISDFNNLGHSAPSWSKVLLAFSQIPPQGIVIKSIDIDIPGKRMRITGTSIDRETVIEFYEKVQSEQSDFEAVEYPLENIARASDISFHFTLNIKDRLLK